MIFRAIFLLSNNLHSNREVLSSIISRSEQTNLEKTVQSLDTEDIQSRSSGQVRAPAHLHGTSGVSMEATITSPRLKVG
jgi:hypothetical protein